MTNDYFEFRKFKVRQDKCAMKVGTDGVLLGGWIEAKGNLRVLDVGAGTGLISMMLAQKTTGKIDSVELDFDAATQVAENYKFCPWSERLTCYPISIQEFAKTNKMKYDLVVSNPPFFNSGQRSEDTRRARARHDGSLSLKHLLELSVGMLSENGRIGVIIPYNLRVSFIKYISLNGLWVIREARIRPLPHEHFIRVMFELGRKMELEYKIEEIIIEDGQRHSYASSFKKYTKDFYLKQFFMQ